MDDLMEPMMARTCLMELLPRRYPDCRLYGECLEKAARMNLLFACEKCSRYQKAPLTLKDLIGLTQRCLALDDAA